jgi:hypothetical protein
VNKGISNWTDISTNTKPPSGLYNYGIAATVKGRLVLYGGITKKGKISRIYYNLTIHSDFWYINLKDEHPEFYLVDLNERYGNGISRIVLLQEETICILKNWFPIK